MMMVLALDEEERQAVLLALAHLAVERPGWDDMLRKIAGRIDAPGTPMYLSFKEIKADPERRSL